ncbi:MAG TPA: YceI family protein [Gemmatimonadaceae bacterium]|nr:YceI family protein [Gemmatimonadaceae bacterium]
MTTTIAHPINEVATRWQIDAAHSNIEFGVRHLMISTVKGRFGEVAGTVTVDPDDPRAVGVDVTLKTASIDTRQEQRDAHLRSADFFDAEKWPVITFSGKRVEGDTDRKFRLFGDLTIRDVTREIVLDVTKEGEGSDPWGNLRTAFSAQTKLDRRDFGLTYNQVLEAGGVVVGDEIKISIDVELTAIVD